MSRNLLRESKRATKSIDKLLEIINNSLGTKYKPSHFYSWAVGSKKTPATVQKVCRRLVINSHFRPHRASQLIEMLEPPKHRG